MTNDPVVSIIIPCYNQGSYLKDALESIKQCHTSSIETIIVNDGSTDKYTNDYLAILKEQGYTIITQDNQGLGAARNTGIKNAKGRYILPLDADNKIRPAYITYGIEILDKHEKVSVVYGNRLLFGEKDGIERPGTFNLQRLMVANYIDACAVIRKSTIEELGYYDNMPVMGYEDWDLWLRIAFAGNFFYYIDELLFDYRVEKRSMIRMLNADIERQNEIENYFVAKYPDKLAFEFLQDRYLYKIKKAPLRFFYRSFLKKIFPGYYNKLIKTNKIYQGFFYDRI